MFRTIALLGLSTLALAACQDQAGGGSAGTRDQIRVVGSSTVFPFTTAVAERFANAHPNFKSPIIESTGTGGGMKLFCAGVGAQHPDIEDASRRMKESEFADCQKNGVKDIVEIQVGIDGIAFAESNKGPKFKLTPDQLYKAIAAEPYGKSNKYSTWSDIDPSLPDEKIQVYGPPSTSGTRDALTELIMTRACKTDPQVAALEKSDEDRFKLVCTKIREDGAYIDSGENDALIVQKLGTNPNAIGVFGYSFLEENMDTVHGIPINGVEPTYETISTFQYPGARPLYIYVKKAHMNAIPGMQALLDEYASAWGPDGYLVKRGLIAAPDDIRQANVQKVKTLPTLTAQDLKTDPLAQ